MRFMRCLRVVVTAVVLLPLFSPTFLSHNSPSWGIYWYKIKGRKMLFWFGFRFLLEFLSQQKPSTCFVRKTTTLALKTFSKLNETLAVLIHEVQSEWIRMENFGFRIPEAFFPAFANEANHWAARFEFSLTRTCSGSRSQPASFYRKGKFSIKHNKLIII